MTVNELIDYVAKYDRKGDAYVVVCDSEDNPQNDGMHITDIVFIETKSGDCKIVLQTG